MDPEGGLGGFLAVILTDITGVSRTAPRGTPGAGWRSGSGGFSAVTCSSSPPFYAGGRPQIKRPGSTSVLAEWPGQRSSLWR